ncbi:protein kinase [Deinococcus radiodurans]|nr:protein kinase [Deinococcus radiodurans]
MLTLPAPEPIAHMEVTSYRAGVQGGSGLWRGQAVYVKTLVSDDPDRVAMFHHEGAVAARLSHPLVTPLLAHTPNQLIFPLLRGGTLRDLVRCGPLDADAATQVTWGVLQAVSHLHGRGVTHHDLKPENVLLIGGQSQVEAVRLIDFGMSHAAGLPLDIHSGTRMGTPQFMAPSSFRASGATRAATCTRWACCCSIASLGIHPTPTPWAGWSVSARNGPPRPAQRLAPADAARHSARPRQQAAIRR